MQLVIEDWLKNQNFNSDVIDLFQESIICFKAGAYRAAYIFSYLAFLNHLKNKIQTSHKPDSIPQGMWDQLEIDLKNEDKWESALIDCLNNATNQVFPISEDLRNQIIYWKNRRNDCVHFKNNFVDHSVVESFWNFLKTFLPKFAVDGSKASLLNDFQKFYDPSLTPPSADISPLIQKMPKSVDKDEIENFVSTVLSFTNDPNRQFEFIEKIFELNDDRIDQELIKFLTRDNKRHALVEYLRYNPVRVHILNGRDSVVRNIWYDYLFQHHINDFGIVASFLRNDLIPDDQIRQLFERIFEVNDWNNNKPTDSELTELNRFDFFEKMESYLLQDNRISSLKAGNRNSRLLKYYLLNTEYSDEIVLKVNNALSGSTYPYAVENRMKEIFRSNREIKDDFKKILDDKSEDYSTNMAPLLEDNEEDE